MLSTFRCLSQISSALAYVHANRIVHLDVKPKNVFVTSRHNCKLGDFGCSRRLSTSSTSVFIEEDDALAKPHLVGTSGYQAPEFLETNQATSKCDTYSFGIMMWQVITGETPFQHMHPHSVIYQVTVNSYTYTLMFLRVIVQRWLRKENGQIMQIARLQNTKVYTKRAGIKTHSYVLIWIMFSEDFRLKK